MDDNELFVELVMGGMEKIIEYSVIKELKEGLDEYIKEKEKEGKEDGKVL